MMRVRKRRHHEERLLAVAGSVAIEPFAAFLGDVGGRIELFRDRRAKRLRADVVVRELVLVVAQRIGVGPPRLQPDVIVPADLVAVGGAEIDVLEAVERQLHFEVAPRLPARRMLLIVRPVARNRLARLRELRPEHLVAGARRRPFEDRGKLGKVLQVALADQRGGVAARAQRIDERVGVERQRRAVAAHAVQRRHAAGHQRRAVGHADRRRHIEPLEARAARGNRIDMRRLENWVAGAAQIIDAMLVGDEEQKVGPLCHR